MEYDISPTESVCVAVIIAVSIAEDRQTESLPPLSEIVDTDAIGKITTPLGDDATPGNVCVSFDYSDSHVTIESGEQITIRPRASDSHPS